MYKYKYFVNFIFTMKSLVLSDKHQLTIGKRKFKLYSIITVIKLKKLYILLITLL